MEKGAEFNRVDNHGKPPIQKILGKEYPLKAHVDVMNGFSAHADQTELLRFLKQSNLNIKRIAIVHGEEEQSLSLAEKLNQEGFKAFVPLVGETVRV
jgi:metallo-beta-lactamase family protein